MKLQRKYYYSYLCFQFLYYMFEMFSCGLFECWQNSRISLVMLSGCSRLVYSTEYHPRTCDQPPDDYRRLGLGKCFKGMIADNDNDVLLNLAGSSRPREILQNYKYNYKRKSNFPQIKLTTHPYIC